jgi:outer membrane protein
MKRNSLLLISWAVLSSGAAYGGDLLTVYRDALAYDAVFAAARASLDAGREKLPQGRAGLLPTVDLTGSTTWNDIDYRARTNAAGTSTGKYNTNAWSVKLTQPVFRWQNWVAYNQSELSVGQSEAQFNLAKQDLIVRVAQAYFDVLQAQEAVTTTQSQKTAIAEQLESAKRNFEVGTTTITDTHEAQARFDLATAQELAAINDLEVKRQTLRTLTGKDDRSYKGLKPGQAIAPPVPDDVTKWTETAETAGFAVQVAQAALEIATYEIDRQRAGHYPTLDVVATHGNSAVGGSVSTSTGSDTRSSTIGLQVTLPLFAGGGTVSRDREAVALREKALSDLDNARRTAALAARQAFLGVTSGLSQVKAYEAALASSRSALESNKLGYEVGVRINIDVLNAQSQLYDTRQKLIKARLDTLMAQLKLKSAAGNLAEDDLASINSLLE